MRLLGRWQHWWRNGAGAPAVEYALRCDCGQALHGARQAAHQVIHCEQCRRAHFVLPLSPLPPVAAPGLPPDLTAPAVRPYAIAPGPARPWLMPLAAGGVTFLLAALGFWLLVELLLPPRAAPPPTSKVDVDQQLEQARRALLAGEYGQALRHLEPLQDAAPGAPRQRRRLAQLQRQAALLHDWPREPLEQILGRTARLNDDEWQAVTERYRGKATVFDVVVRRDASRQYWVKPMGPGGIVTMNLDLQEMRLLAQLPLDAPQRLLFAGRIAELRRTGPATCAVRLDPDSAVLLTDVTAAGLGNLVPETALAPILAQQKQWVEEG